MNENTTHLIDDRYSFKDIVDIEHLREILEKFSAATGYKTGLVSYPQQELLINTGWQDICKKFHQVSPESEKICMASNKYLTEQLEELKQVRVSQCGNGLVVGATPVIIEGKHVANLVAGQILVEEPDLRQFEKQAEAFGYDLNEYMHALDIVPVVDREKFSSTISFLGEIALMIAELGLKNLKLKKSEEKFRAIFYQTFSFLGLLTPEGILMEVNKTALSFARINESEVVGKLFWETPWWTHSQGLQHQLRDAISRAASGDLVNFESSHPGPDGIIHYIDVSIKPVKDDRGNVILLIPEGHDITERKQAEELVRVERDLGIKLSQASSLEEVLNLCLQSAIRISGMDCGGVYLVNEQSGNIDLAVKSGLSDKYVECVSQYSADSYNTRLIMKGEPIYTRYQNLVDNLDNVHRLEGLKAIAVIPILYHYRVVACLNVASHSMDEVVRFSRTSLETIASHIGASIMHAKREEELRHLRNYLSNIINSMPSVLIGVDGDCKITQWNRQAEKETGIESGTAAGRKLEEVFPRLASEMEKIHTAMRKRQAQRDPKKLYQEEGEARYESVTVYPLITNGVEGVVIHIDDVTMQVRLEEMMIQSEKMLSVGGLAAGMAHEINNPLAGMMQNASVLINRLTGDLPSNYRAAEECGTDMNTIRTFMEKRDVIKILNLIHESGCRAANIVQNMLSFARKSDSKATLTNIGKLLDRTVELAENDYNLKKKFDFRQIEIIREYESGMQFVSCEASKIQQVFLNLLKNGAEAMSEGRQKQGKQKGKVEKPRFVLRVSREGEMAKVEIEDNGLGMDEATRKRIFEPFFTTKKVGTGTGLGLSVSYFIITENHGGTMRVESIPDKGTNFIIRLPMERKNT